jgi:AcrR family transcriptional regulator
MADDLDDLLPPSRPPTSADVPSAVPAALELLSRFVPDRATPEQRLQVLEIRTRLKTLQGEIAYALRAIDTAYLRAASETGAKQFPLSSGQLVKVAPPATQYQVDEQELYEALRAFIPGTLTEDEVEAAIHREVVFKVNHATLNTIARNRGDAVRWAIERHRTVKVPSELAGTVTYPHFAMEEKP